MSLSKKYLKSKPICKVTFRLPKQAVGNAKKVALVGDFNDWKKSGHVMSKLKDGSYKLVLDLDVGKEYQFRYLLDGKTWENDWNADKYVQSGVSDEENSVIII